MDHSADKNQQRPVKKMRWIGFFMFTAGGALTYLSFILPLLEASHHEEDISISRKGVMFAPALIVFGLILFFFGNNRAGQIFGGRPQGLTALGWIVTIATGRYRHFTL